MMRFPDINGNLITFVYAGDIWTVDAAGGNARRVTSHPGLELFPKISPDGRWIAFSAEYSGSRQIWVMPAEGGTAHQLTFYNSVGEMPPRGGYDHVVLDWSPDSKRILFRANRTSFGDRNGRYFTVNLEGGLEEPLPIVNGGFATFSPDGSQLCFTPVDRGSVLGKDIREDVLQSYGTTTWQRTNHDSSPIGPAATSGLYGMATISTTHPTATVVSISGDTISKQVKRSRSHIIPITM